MNRVIYECYKTADKFKLVLVEEIDQFNTRLYDVELINTDDKVLNINTDKNKIHVQFPPVLVKLSYDGLLDLLSKFYVKLVKKCVIEDMEVII